MNTFATQCSSKIEQPHCKKHFKKYGEIIDSVIMRDRATGHTRGFGFVTYLDPSVVDRVMQDKHVLDGKTVSAKQ